MTTMTDLFRGTGGSSTGDLASLRETTSGGIQ